MRDIDRIKPFLDEFGEIWKTNFPDWRFGQLMCNLQSYVGSDLFYCEENKILEILHNYVGDLNERL